MRSSFTKKIICVIASLIMVFSVVFSSAAVFSKETEDNQEDDLCYQSIDIYPNGEDSEEVVTLDGDMPEGATVDAVDVTDKCVDGSLYDDLSAEIQVPTDNTYFATGSDAELATPADGIETVSTSTDAEDDLENYSVLAAYDITISDGNEEYQPDSEHPISVSITNPNITENMDLKIWHIKDDGEREEVKEFSVEDGRLVFDAYGFSVYEIMSLDDIRVSQFFDNLARDGENGFYVSAIVSKDGTGDNGLYYFTDQLVNNITDTGRNGIKTTAKSATPPGDAVKLYFERYMDTRNRFYIYTLDDIGNRNYIRIYRENSFGAKRSAVAYTTDVDEATPFSLELNSRNQVRASAVLGDKLRHYLVRADKGAFVGYADVNDKTMAWMTIDESLVPQSIDLDGRTFGLMNYTGGTNGYALMANPQVHALLEVFTHQTSVKEGITVFVDEGSEVTKWTFHKDGNGKYKLAGATDGGTKYLTVNGDALTVTENEADAVSFEVSVNSDKLRLKYNGKYVTLFSSESEGKTTYYYSMSDTASANSDLNLIDFASVEEDDLYIYSAEKVSVSDLVNGEKYIVYTRIWNKKELKYDLYAVDFDGSLYPVYANGGEIRWLGDGSMALEWDFTEYYDSVTKKPNYYYELFNPYSEKYMAPQKVGDQILSDNTIGINLPGRRDGEYYSDILAWDTTYYTYVGYQPNDEKTKLIPSSKTDAFPFYFAKLTEMNKNDKLHEVATLDNKDYGITIKIQDYKDSDEQEKILGKDPRQDLANGHKNILSTDVGADGYPVVARTTEKKSLGELFKNATEVNHLFMENEYNTSGYFEFDSCQNFATLCDEDGNLKPAVDGVIDFTVYQELGTTDTGEKTTLKHGQFLPFNIIKADQYTSRNPINLYSALANLKDSKAGLLSDDDPRKYEKLHKILDNNGKDKPDYQYGLELSASFVQTVSGMDAWGHDIVFNFTGDDDFWLYVDDELVIDLGGVHSALAGSVNFRTGDVKVSGLPDRKLRQVFEDNYRGRNPSATTEEVNNYLSQYFEDGKDIFKNYSQHTMKVYYMERGGGAANLNMKFNLASVTPGSVVLSKEISGDDNNVLDKSFLEYPFQMFYTLKDSEGKEHVYPLTNHDPYAGIRYQNSNKAVTFVDRYKPPGIDETKAYENVFFINPTLKAEITFPENTVKYRIVECAVDRTIYDNVKINGVDVPPERKEINGDLISYESELQSADQHPTISFDNHVKDGVIKNLYIKKKLVDENGDEITNDPGEFSYRLYLSSVDMEPKDLPLANMYKYYVLTSSGTLCKHNYTTGDFEDTGLIFSDEKIKDITDGNVPGVNVDDVTFTTSGFGAISNIPSNHTIVVPGLPVGAVFKITEDDKPGYGLDKYEMEMGYKDEGGQHIELPSYSTYIGEEDNVGKVIKDFNPIVDVVNKKGYGLTAKKNWSDLDITTYHDPIYVAVYVDGKLLDGSVRKIESPRTSTYYFWSSLVPYPSGRERTNLDGYVVKEVKVENGNVIPLESGDSINLEVIPEGSTTKKAYDYNVSYSQGEEVNSTRTDVITNTREGGLAIRLFKWGTDTPLANGVFELQDPSGNEVEKFTSDSDGIVDVLYDFERNKLYTLTQVEAPQGYVGLQKKLKFKVDNEDKLTIYNEDGTTIWGTDSADVGWVIGKVGQNGLTAYVDIYNKVFNFKIEKSDSIDPNNKLGAAHFALYKQTKNAIGGYTKNAYPMSGFEDIVTINGEATVCGEDTGRIIKPGPDGTVFYLTETQAPPNYSRMTKDIIFKLSPTGVPSLVDAGDSRGKLVETADSYIYRLSVPNTKLRNGKVLLSVTKTVIGSMGDRNKDFRFTFTVDENPVSEGYEWYKNGVKQSDKIKSGETFTLKHKEEVVINLPQDSKVTVKEQSTEYTTTIQKDSEAEIDNTNISVEMDKDTKLTFKNKLNDPTETGIKSGSKLGMILIILISFIVVAGNIYLSRLAKK